jgi:hypothetical protein
MDKQKENIIAIWQAAWYELDQPIKLGLKDTFWLVNKTGTLLKIRHRTIGDASEIDTEGLTYKITLISGQEIIVEAEETPGRVENDFPSFDNDNWKFEVTIKPTLAAM